MTSHSGSFKIVLPLGGHADARACSGRCASAAARSAARAPAVEQPAPPPPPPPAPMQGGERGQATVRGGRARSPPQLELTGLTPCWPVTAKETGRSPTRRLRSRAESGPSCVVELCPPSPIPFCSILKAVQLSTAARGPRVPSVVSSRGRDGKSTTAMALARGSAAKRREGASVNGDLRNPSLFAAGEIEVAFYTEFADMPPSRHVTEHDQRGDC